MAASKLLLRFILLALSLPIMGAQAQVTFFQPPTYAGSGALFVDDFNGDGKPDLLSADGTMQLGNGNGRFTTGTKVAGGVLAVADFNGDGKLDVLQQGRELCWCCWEMETERFNRPSALRVAPI